MCHRRRCTDFSRTKPKSRVWNNAAINLSRRKMQVSISLFGVFWQNRRVVRGNQLASAIPRISKRITGRCLASVFKTKCVNPVIDSLITA